MEASSRYKPGVGARAYADWHIKIRRGSLYRFPLYLGMETKDKAITQQPRLVLLQ